MRMMRMAVSQPISGPDVVSTYQSKNLRRKGVVSTYKSKALRRKILECSDVPTGAHALGTTLSFVLY